MSVEVDYNLFSRYFSVSYIDFENEIISAGFLFCSGLRPQEFLNLGVEDFYNDPERIEIYQIKEGNLTKRDIATPIFNETKSMFTMYGNPGTYYRTYQTLKSHIMRTITPLFSVPDRLNDLYLFRYACCACLQYQGCTETEIVEFFDHINSNNTKAYADKGIYINAQLT